MRLKKLEVYGFKSFADRVEITFDSGITGIVGPNGSGKSNITDAVRWVLGEQSVKALRGSKMEDVIFNGTQQRKPLHLCEVSLTLDNTDGFLDSPYSEVTITRRVYRSGEGEYFINKTACRLKDIVELLRDTGIGRDGYSLIGQGRVDEILSNKSEDRREVFEEAVGIGKYKARKEEAEKRLLHTTQNLDRVEDILVELERQLEPLSRQSETARKYLLLRDELKSIELNAFLLRHRRMEEVLEGIQAQSQQEALQQGQLQLKDETLQHERQALLRAMEDTDVQLADAQNEVVEKTKAHQIAESQHQVLLERDRYLKRDMQHARQQRAQHEKSEAERALEVEKRTIQLGLDRASLLEDRKTLSADIALSDQKRSELEKESQALEEEKQKLIDTMGRLSDARASQTRLETMRQHIGQRIEVLGQHRQEDELRQLELEEKAKTLSSAWEIEKTALADAGSKLVALQAERQAAIVAHENSEKELNAMRAQRQDTASRLKVLREMQRDYEGYSNAVRQVLLHKRKHPEIGVDGVVAELFTVPKQIERAVEVALGPSLQHIVTNTEEDARDMIALLKRGNLGRATFLPLGAIKGRTISPNERFVLDMPGCLGVASEMISFAPKYRSIAENLLGRTIIAKDLDSGIALMRAGKHAFRLVTLDGDVMNAGGSMTGGSHQSSVTRLLSREREVGEHEARLTAMDEAMQAKQTEITQYQTLLVDIRAKREACFANQREAEITCTRAQEHFERASEACAENRRKKEQALLETEQLQEQLEDIEKELDLANRSQGSAALDQHQAQQAIAKKARDIAIEREAMETKRELLTQRQVALAAQERDLLAAQRDLEALQKRGKEMDAEKAEQSLLLEKMDKEATELENQLSSVLEIIAQAEEMLAKAKAVLDEVEARRKQQTQSLSALTEKLEDVRSTLEGVNERIHKLEIQKSKTEGERQTLCDRIWQEYELTYQTALVFEQEGFVLSHAEKQVAKMRAEIRELGAVNVQAIDEYQQVSERHAHLAGQKADLVKAQEDLRGLIEELVGQMQKQFQEGFEKLNAYFAVTFERLFGGGKAELVLSDEKDVLNCSIDIVAQPPGKKLQLMSLLSGGERALTAIAILFAMLQLKPTPFCFLDEIEAALDEANVAHFASYLMEYAQSTQFAVVTHRKGTMERCHALYGVTMEEKGISRILSLRLSDEKGA